MNNHGQRRNQKGNFKNLKANEKRNNAAINTHIKKLERS